MDNLQLIQQLGELEGGCASAAFDNFLRGSVRSMIIEVMANEVAEMCGPKHLPLPDAKFERAGSAVGSVRFAGEKVVVQRPRVREAGEGEEAHLKSYQVAKDPAEIRDALMRALIGGVSCRDQERVHDQDGCSRSHVSRLWITEGEKMVDDLRSRQLDHEGYLVLMLDGIGLGNDLLAIVALGITQDGSKQLLDFEIGSSENAVICQNLLTRLVERDFKPAAKKLLVVTDGAKALTGVVRKRWSHAVLQRCLVHKERNLHGYVSKRHHKTVSAHMHAIRTAEGATAGRAALKALRDFLDGVSSAAVASLDEAGDSVIAVHLINAPKALYSTLLSTNCIENAYLNVRRRVGRVTRWRAETDMASRWLAMALTTAEAGFRRINNYAELPKLTAALNR
jgi:transposase-like protein